MVADEPAPARPEFLAALERDCAEGVRVLRGLTARTRPGRSALRRAAGAYADAAHRFAFLEGNHRHLDGDPLRAWRDRFFGDAELDRRVLSGLIAEAERHPDEDPDGDPDDSPDRARWISWLRGRLDGAERDADRRVAAVQLAAKAVLAEIRQEQAALAVRIGLTASPTDAAAALHRAVAGSGDDVRRAKLLRVWRAPRERRADELAGILDGMVGVHRQRAQDQGDRTPLRRTLRRCRVAEAEVAEFLRGCLTQALRAQAELAAEVRATTGCDERPLDQLGRHLRLLFGGWPAVPVPLDGCLEYLSGIANRVFGLAVVRVDTPGSDSTITFSVRAAGRPVGRILACLVPATAAPAFPATPVPDLPSRPAPAPGAPEPDAGRAGELPTGYLLCRVRPGRDGRAALTFDAAHSLAHEFGHAINHLLVRRRLPGDSGLEYLPVERIEELSTWWENWVYHPDFPAALNLTGTGRDGLLAAQRAKALEFIRTGVDRAVVALLDFEVHRHGEGTLRDGFRRLCEEYPLSGKCDFDALLEHFTWPIFRAFPGANFTYLWGAAFGAERFPPFVAEGSAAGFFPTRYRRLVDPCLDPDAPSLVPDSGRLFDHYRDIGSSAGQGHRGRR